VTADVVAFLRHAVNDMRKLSRVPSQYEEGCDGLVLSEQVKESRSYFLAWAIVISQSKKAIFGGLLPDSPRVS
jgi:hypothetical protein